MVKKIINWTANGFFRSLGRFLFFFCITAILVLIFANSSVKITDLLGIDTVYASTQNYSSAYMSVKTCAPNSPSYSCNWYGNWALNSGYHAPNDTDFQGYLNEWDLHVVGSNNIVLTPDKTYTIVFGIGVSSSNVGTGSTQHSLYYFLKQLKRPTFKMVGSTNAGESGGSTSYIKSYSCTMTENENAINRVYVTCTFVPNGDLKYFRAAIIYGDNTDLYFDQYGFMTIDSFTYSEDASGAVNQQTIIIENGFQNIENIINENNQALIDSNKSCQFFDKSDILISNYFLGNTGNLVSNEYNWGITDFIKIDPKADIIPISVGAGSSPSMCFYNTNKSLIGCISNSSLTLNTKLVIPDSSVYVRFSIQSTNNYPQFQICKNGSQALEDTLTDDNVDGDTNDMIDFFNDFELEGSGDIDTLLTIPITFIENVFTTNSTADLCVTFRSQNICLPNGKILWNRTYQCNEQVMLCDSNNGSVAGLLNLFSTLFGGYLAYKIMRSIFHTYNDILDPTKDKVEVMDL